MIKTLIDKSFFVVLVLALPAVGAAQHRAAYGPIESLDLEGSRVTVLGQTFSITDATKIAIDGRAVNASEFRLLVTNYRTAYIEGAHSDAGSAASLLNFSSTDYVEGSTTVLVEGRIIEVSPSFGLVRIGQLWIDVSAVNPNLVATAGVGVSVQISGIQPVARSRLVGDVRMNLAGRGLRSPVLAEDAWFLDSIGGSGVSALRIGESALGVNSIGGSGKSTLSIGGSGSQISSIGGSGTTALSIGGSGSQSTGFGGLSTSVTSIGGSGANLSSIGGSGRSSLSIGGSGNR